MNTYYDTHFTETREMVTITFNGWDSKSYNGEPCRRKVYTTPDGKRYVRAYSKGWRCYHILTGEKHPISGIEIVSCKNVYEPHKV